MLAFHGFGLEGKHMVPLAEAFGKEYTFFSFDLFYHGKSFWRSGEAPLTKLEWKEILKALFAKHDIDRFSLSGFSLGGKFVLASLEGFPNKVDEIFFIAPDGIKTHIFYSLATYPVAFRKFFKSLIVRPQRFGGLARTMLKLNLVDKGIIRFAQSQMNTVKKRRRVYYAWVIFRKLKFNMKRVAYLINQHDIKVTMYLGRYDKIITQKNMDRLLKKLDDYDLEVIETGHNDLLNGLAYHLYQRRKPPRTTSP